MRGLICGLVIAVCCLVSLNAFAEERQIYFLGGDAPHIKDNIDVSGWKKFDVKCQCWQNTDCSWLIEMFRGTNRVSKAEGEYRSSHEMTPQTVTFYAWAPDAFHVKLTAKTNKMRFALENVEE